MASVSTGLLAGYPRDDGDDRAEQQHRRDREEEFEPGTVDDDVTRQSEQRQRSDPGPGKAQQDQDCAEANEHAIHRRSLRLPGHIRLRH